MRQNGLITVVRYAARWALAPLCFMVAGTSAAQVRDDVAISFCWHAEETVAARSQCELDYAHGARQYLAYGVDKGFLLENGTVVNPGLSEFLADWRLLLGAPSGKPFNHCTTKFAFQQKGIDFRAVWACLVELDPDAARMDQI